MILLHAGGSSGAQWRRVCERLADRWRPVTVDFYGHGGTSAWPGPPEGRTHEAEAELVRAVIGHLGGESVGLVGHSYGGGVALRLVIEHRALVRRMVLIEPQCWSMLRHGGESAYWAEVCGQAHHFIAEVEAGRPENAWRGFIDGNNAPGFWDSLSVDARTRLLAMTDALPSAYHANLNHATTPVECQGIDVPTLVLVGARTFPRYRRMTELVARHLPRARLEVLPEVGHMSPVTHPDVVAHAIEQHLTEFAGSDVVRRVPGGPA